MNQNHDIKILLEKFVLNQCTADEIEQVVSYFRTNKMTADFPTVEEIKSLIGEMPKMETFVAEGIFANIMNQSEEKEIISIAPKKSNWRRYAAIAASVVVLLSIGISYQKGFFTNEQQTVIDKNSNQITLQLENGEIQVISENTTSTVKDENGNVIGNHNRDKIVYDNETPIENLVYNTIKIPYGKRFQLQLSDGTIVHLNAGTTLKYPVKFLASQNRQVFLEGEAYFDVAKDKKHPFVINADELNVRVLGTHFNVSNYPEDDQTDVVLVEGSVGMYGANEIFDATKNTILKPGFKGSFDRKNKSIDTKAVSTDYYTSWIRGGLSFRNMAFKNICKKLERKYNVKIVNQNNKFETEVFNASFEDEPLTKILSYFNDIHSFDYYQKDNYIIIK
ncbi:hypothetical protein FNO01nite_25390 [Flavobacterium noncentrifugens]|uniref:FecR family protein n=1 Tax=Flavobacterium noncentrifugens TaxID=1128970 RepID=A0A1G8ZQT6_9FLAO|nr:FecR family protein [Flavobacterium noncentrifugens]GEP51867.1 hypothetical protein FNO01nite_25390 [Flavobacterium noncentrifugens]SDK17411.1 FecR family protein [Flavobacterium noncentrifugens]